MTRTCKHPDCEATFTVLHQKGQPPKFCPEHRTTKYAMIRNRHHPELKTQGMPACCQQAGRTCNQHRQFKEWRTKTYRPSEVERAVIGDLIDVFGHVSIWGGSNGKVIGGIRVW